MKIVRVTADSSGGVPANAGSRGPIVLQHGSFFNSEVWYTVNDPSDLAYPNRLYDEGFDVWIMNWRGYAPYNRGHEDPNKDPDAFPEAYFDFDDSTIAENEVPAAIDKILRVRAEDGLECKKVQMLAFSRGTYMSLVTAATYP